MAQCSSSLLLLTLIHLISLISARDFLDAGSHLSIVDSSHVLHSRSGTFSCGFYRISPNASTFSVWFTKSSSRTIVWSMNALRPVYNISSTMVKLYKGGRMELVEGDQIVWTNNVNDSAAIHVRAELLDEGNLIVKRIGDATPLWQSFDSPTDTLLPTQKISASTKLVSSNRKFQPGNGNYSCRFDDQDLLSLFYQQEDMPIIYWPDPTSNIWGKLRKQFNSIINGSLDRSGHFVASDNTTFTAADFGPSIMRRLTLDSDGNLRLYSLRQADGNWSVTWMAFYQLCKVHGLCGRNGICVYTPEPACACAPGFEFNDPTEWSKGCKPKFRISRDAQKVKFARLPHTDFFGNDISSHVFVSFDECQKICLNDYKCVGFAYWEGHGGCYPKDVLYAGSTLRHSDSTGTMFIKINKEVKENDSLIPQSQPLGPKYGIDCASAEKYFKVDLKEDKNSKNNWYLYLLYGFLSAVFLAEVLFIVLGWFILWRERSELRGLWPTEAGYEIITNHFRRFTYKELVIATRNFKYELRRGASGITYKGDLDDNRAVAVKKLKFTNQGEEEFRYELSLISRINHMNLVRIFGFCFDGPYRILVSEYVEKGSLDKILFGNEGSEILLDWKQRFHIALGVARGLAYLHHECLEWVIHCDVKPENILLDENLEPKIADFGLAKLLNRGVSNINISRIQGTRGYLAPEWVSSLPITVKVDVYSFGVVLLELLKGARVSDMEKSEDEEMEMVLRRMIHMLKVKLQLAVTEEYWINDFIDPKLNGQFNKLQAKTMMKLAVSCLEEDRAKRPTMEDVAQTLVSFD